MNSQTAKRSVPVAVIAGAGPAGLTAALELLRRSNVMPIIFECDDQVGGISKTIKYRGNRMDLGGHRFFSKSDWVMRWWHQILPIAHDDSRTHEPLRTMYQGQIKDFTPELTTAASTDLVMLIRNRLSRIFYNRRFFDYPLRLNANTFSNIGLVESLHIGMSYGRARLSQRHPETTLEDFFINRFGDRLYRTFFKSYTEKVWGVPCADISAEWGAQRIKGLSITKAIAHALKPLVGRSIEATQKSTETSLIERFLYPKLGPGQMWEEVARQVEERGGIIHLRHRVVGVERIDQQITGLKVYDEVDRSTRAVPCDHFVSTMPVSELTRLLGSADASVARIASALPYRDFMTAGLLVRRMQRTSSPSCHTSPNGMPPDNWIYIQEPDVRLGRIQIFNNWSPAMVADPNTIWLGLEYFCREGDDLWSMDDARFLDLAARELETIGLVDRRDVIDGTVVRVRKAYPAYFGSYGKFGVVREYLSSFANLYPVGRNGMHRYNNQDHSMLAANGVVNSIINDGRGKDAIWDVNTDDEYHEEIGTAIGARALVPRS